MTIKEFKKRYKDGEVFIAPFENGDIELIYKGKPKAEIIGDGVYFIKNINGKKLHCSIDVIGIIPASEYISKMRKEKIEDEKQKVMLSKFAIALKMIPADEDVLFDDVLKMIKDKTTFESKAIDYLGSMLYIYVQNNYEKGDK